MTGKFQDFLSWNIYQIYPRSFYDSNGDGIGDLRGVISKLDYLKDLGINAIWLCPCFKSPNEDNGYDVSDYRDIMDEFGTMEDAKELISQMHSRDMKLIMDLVPNHTSAEHVWFQESRKSKDNPYSDYYYWFDSPPNDWPSMFGGSAWQYDEGRGQYYLHSYAVGQPDLNWENPAVLKEMQDVVDFWVDLGVDGFRIDVIDQISKDFVAGKNSFGPRLHEYIHALFGREKTKHIFTVGECWAGDIEEVRRHCDPARNELSTLFQFGHQACGRHNKFTQKPDSLQSVWRIISGWENLMQDNGLLYSLFTDNHDNGWFLGRVGNTEELRYESATCIASMVYLMRGVAFVYQGQEIGMLNAHYESIEEFDDVESINMYRELLKTMSPEEAVEKINFGGRDNTRRPMCWTAGENGGFTTGKPWIPLHSSQKKINLESDLAADKSVFRFYRQLLHMRRNLPALKEGSFREISAPDSGYCVFERVSDDQKLVIVCNFEQERHIAQSICGGKLILSNYGHAQKTDDLFAPYEVAVFEVENNA